MNHQKGGLFYKVFVPIQSLKAQKVSSSKRILFFVEYSEMGRTVVFDMPLDRTNV